MASAFTTSTRMRMRRTSGGCLRRGRVVNGATGVRLARETRSVNICAGMERVAPPGAVVVGVGIARVCAVKRAEERGHGGERLAVVVCGKWKPRPAGSGAKKRGGGGNKKQNGMNDFDEQPPMMNEDIMYVLCRTSVFGWSPRAPTRKPNSHHALSMRATFKNDARDAASPPLVLPTALEIPFICIDTCIETDDV